MGRQEQKILESNSDRLTDRLTDQWMDWKGVYSVSCLGVTNCDQKPRIKITDFGFCQFRLSFDLFKAMFDVETNIKFLSTLWFPLVNLYKPKKINQTVIIGLGMQFLSIFAWFLNVFWHIWSRYLCETALVTIFSVVVVGNKQLVKKNSTNHWLCTEICNISPFRMF